MAGLTAEGFEPKTLEELQNEIVADQLELVDTALDVSPEQPLGQLNGIFAKQLSDLQSLMQTFANAMNPNAAENFLLDNICALTGTKREPAKKSKVDVNCTVTAGATFAAGQITLNVVGQPERRFKNVDAVGPLAAGVESLAFESEEYGPVQALAGTLTVITTPISGLTSVTNPLDAEPGAQVEQDADLRKRRQDELTAPGACTVDSIRADVLQVEGVKQCYVFENTTLTTDVNGLPGKSIEVVIHDGLTPEADDADIAQVVWDSKPAGTETYGTTTENVTDSVGVVRTVKFSRATVKNVWLEYDVVVDASFFPTTGADMIKAAAAAYGDQYLNLGLDVFAVAFKAAVYREVPGILDIPALRLGFTVSPVGTTNLTITGREIADVDTSRMVVNVSSGSP